MAFTKAAAAVLAAALLTAALVPAGTAQQAQQPPAQFEPTIEPPESLPEFPGREEAYYLCIACHGLAIVRRQALTRDGWEAMIDLMVARHGMMEPVGEERRIIVDYLAQAFPPRQQPAGGWRNPFAPQ